MELADQIVLINEGRIEQAGTPADLYERPANDFVMNFVGPVTKLDGELIRPHDVEILGYPGEATVEAVVERVLHLGFEVRVDLALGDGSPVTAQLTRGEAEELELRPGDIVHVRGDRPRVAA